MKVLYPTTGPMNSADNVQCDFERSCAWSWDVNQTNGFKVTTGPQLVLQNISGNYLSMHSFKKVYSIIKYKKYGFDFCKLN